ncbi:MAG: hypothetical protein OEV94_10805 [Deltaproteobacteria bacterium]|nr:hypothetical protein [Deltaproteobacteria bacterium]
MIPESIIRLLSLPYLVPVAIGFRSLWELRRWRGAPARLEPSEHSSGGWAPYGATLVWAGLALGEYGMNRPHVGGWAMVVGLGLWGGTLALRGWAQASLEQWPVNPGPKAPHAPKNLSLPPVTQGPYRFLRHPEYAAVLGEVLAVELLTGGWWSLAVGGGLVGGAVLWQIRAEEARWGEDTAWKTHTQGLKRLLPKVW